METVEDALLQKWKIECNDKNWIQEKSVILLKLQRPQVQQVMAVVLLLYLQLVIVLCI